MFLTVVVTAFEGRVFWPRFRAAVDAGVPGARTRAYRRVVAGQWAVALVIVAVWLAERRSWAALGLLVPGGWRGAASAVIVLAVAALFSLQIAAVRRLTPGRTAAAAPRLGDVALVLPRTAGEARWFTAVSLTAGIVEELLYRGYLLWALAPAVGAPGAALASVVLFGAGHAYQGRAGALRATAVGAVLTLIVVVTGSVVPAMVVHAIVDVAGGIVGRTVLEGAATRPAALSEPA